jgi:pimeloyl-ACP methyl ester carboxylesterase
MRVMPLRKPLLAGLVVLAACMSTWVRAQALELTRHEGTLADGTPWQIIVPAGWNGTILLDLDFYTSQSRYEALYRRGFAGAGIRRTEAGDAQANAAQLINVLDIFGGIHGKPAYAIANGRSQGAVTSTVLMETYPERIDGALAQCTVPGYIASYNSKLDHAFAANVLLGGTLGIVGIPTDATQFNALVGAWSKLISDAQQTPQGKARIALAHALGQLPVWSNPAHPKPQASNDDQLQQAMFTTLHGQFAPATGSRLGVRRVYEQATGGVFNWNTGVDYARIFEQMVRPEIRSVVREFYRRANLDLAADLQRINDAPRIAADPAAIVNVQRRGGHTANPARPIMFNQAIGDATTQAVTVQSYIDRAAKAGKSALVRATFVDTAGHCAFPTATYVAVVEALDERVRTGQWPSTTPEQMNARALKVDPAAAPVFVDYQLEPFARPFFLGDDPPVGTR